MNANEKIGNMIKRCLAELFIDEYVKSDFDNIQSFLSHLNGNSQYINIWENDQALVEKAIDYNIENKLVNDMDDAVK